jgi:hypothetical protein
MIVEDERDEDELDPLDPEEIPTNPKKADIYDKPTFDANVERDQNQLAEFMRRYKEIRCPVVNKTLECDLVNHLWNMKLQEQHNNA